MGEVEKKFKNVIKEKSKVFEGNSQIQNFENAGDFFDKLVSKGLASKRGNNLMSSEEAHLKRYSFNSRS